MGDVKFDRSPNSRISDLYDNIIVTPNHTASWLGDGIKSYRLVNRNPKTWYEYCVAGNYIGP